MDKYDFQVYKKPNLKQKLFEKQKIDIFFHNDIVSKTDIYFINISSVLIVSSNATKELMTNNDKIKTSPQNIYVIYPSVDIPKIDKQQKKIFLEKRNLHRKTTILYFTANEFKKTGVEVFCKIINSIEASNFIAVISGKTSQLKPTVQLLNEMGLSKKIILTKETIFDISDIFILPTSNKLFAYNCLIAMANKNIVFAPQTNSASELLDSFLVMDSCYDETISYRINMLIENTDELKLYQKINSKIAKKWTIKKQFKQLKKIIKAL